MHICIGINGIGVGHSIRQHRIVDELHARGCRVTVLSTGRGLEYFRARQASTWDAKLAVIESYMPRFISKARRLDWADTLRAEVPKIPRMVSLARRLREQLDDVDVFITDYEPYSSYLAEILRRPLFSVDQQSKYRYFSLAPCANFTQAPERQRLALFAPRVQHAYIGSFAEPARLGLDADHAATSVSLVPAILASDIRAAATGSERQTIGDQRDAVTVAYFSSYFSEQNRTSLAETVRAVEGLCGRKMRIYSPDPSELCDLSSDQIEIRGFERSAFVDDLKRADSVVSTAGFNLIAECISLQIPMMVVPVATYDQRWCADSINRLGFGWGVDEVDERTATAFFSEVEAGAFKIDDGSRNYLLSSDPASTVTDDLLSKVANS